MKQGWFTTDGRPGDRTLKDQVKGLGWLFEHCAEVRLTGDDHSNVLTNLVYRRILGMSPQLVTDYVGDVPKQQGDAVRLIDAKILVLDRRLVFRGNDIHHLANQIVDVMRPHFGFMSNVKHFAFVTLDMRCDASMQWGAQAIWGVA